MGIVHLMDFVQNRAPRTYEISSSLSVMSLQIPIGFGIDDNDPENIAANRTSKAIATQENIDLGIAITPQVGMRVSTWTTNLVLS